MRASLRWIFTTPTRFHMWGALAIVVVATSVISGQVADRQGFANGALYQDVLDRWGTPIDQPAPSVRYVESGTIFNALAPLPLASQQIEIVAEMNYRKRGLVYFSGFDFAFSGHYRVQNPEPRDIDIVFVFPVALDRNKVLLSELTFSVNDEAATIALGESGDKLVWTGRLGPGDEATFVVGFKGRGLDAFTYRLDPAHAVRDFRLDLTVHGGDNYDYPFGVVPAHVTSVEAEAIHLAWNYPALESGVPVGAVLPSEKSFDTVIATMARRSWAPFLILLVGLVILATAMGKRLRIYETYLFAAGYGFFFVLLAYLAAFMNFYLAYVLSTLLIIALLSLYVRRLLDPRGGTATAGLLVALLTVPTFAVIAQNYTGLIYSLEILAGLALLMSLTTRQSFTNVVDQLGPTRQEVPHGA